MEDNRIQGDAETPGETQGNSQEETRQERPRETFASAAMRQLEKEWKPDRPFGAVLGTVVAHKASVVARFLIVLVMVPTIIALLLFVTHATMCAPAKSFKDARYGNFVQTAKDEVSLSGLGTVEGAEYSLPKTITSPDGRTWKVTGISQCALSQSNVRIFRISRPIERDKMYWGLEKSKVCHVELRDGAATKSVKEAVVEANPHKVDYDGMKVSIG